jgi:hypothetical protein
MARQMVASALLVLLVAPPALAQHAQRNAPERPDNYITAYFNVNFGGGLMSDRKAGESSSGLGASFTFWGRGTYSAEVDFNYSRDFFGPAEDDGDSRLMTLTFGGVIGPWVRAGSGHLRPYAAFGGGLMRSSIDEFVDFGWDDTTYLGVVEAGGGLLWLFNSSVGVRGDLRYRWGVGDAPDEGGWSLVDKWTYMRATIGVTLAF